jgi:cytochrome c biogenesis protein CcmG, thiol:disulfide interchange protein DsbE
VRQEMNQRNKAARIWPAIGLLCMVTLMGCSQDGSGPAAGGARQAAPAFQGRSLSGEHISLAELRGKVVLVNFWATWCGPCRLEIPELAKLYETYGEQGFVVIGLSLDSQSEIYVQTEARRMGANYPIVLLGESGGQEWGGISAIPTSFLIDRQGRIVQTLMGYTPIDRLADLLRPLLKEAA